MNSAEMFLTPSEERDIERVAELLRARNEIDAQLATIVGRPAEKGHVGEWIAARLFDIDLSATATQAGFDGRFRSGPEAGRTVNIKWYAKRDGLIDINPAHLPDYFLVLCGRRSAAATSRNTTRPWLISEVFLFETTTLMEKLRERGCLVGDATSVTRDVWESARIFPGPRIEERRASLLLGFGPP